MVAKASIIEIYARADAAGRVDIICKNYSNFIGIVDGYTEGLRYMIESEKAYNRKKNHGDLGVRVQTSGIHSDITADTAISNVITRDAIIACDFSGDVLEGVDRGEKYRKDAYTLRRMSLRKENPAVKHTNACMNQTADCVSGWVLTKIRMWNPSSITCLTLLVLWRKRCSLMGQL